MWWSFHDELVYNDGLRLDKVREHIQSWNQIRGQQTSQNGIGPYVFHNSGEELQPRIPRKSARRHKTAKKISNFYVANVKKTGWHYRYHYTFVDKWRFFFFLMLIAYEKYFWMNIFYREKSTFFFGQGLLLYYFHSRRN